MANPRLEKRVAMMIQHNLAQVWLEKPIFSKLEDAVTYQGHHEICGCWERGQHTRDWTVAVLMREDEARLLMGLLNRRP